jgi:hypothetical protein
MREAGLRNVENPQALESRFVRWKVARDKHEQITAEKVSPILFILTVKNLENEDYFESLMKTNYKRNSLRKSLLKCTENMLRKLSFKTLLSSCSQILSLISKGP